MACNNKCNSCGDCTDCNCNCSKLPCGCSDIRHETPCGYTDCSPGNERCDDVQCTECVSYCGSTFQVETPGGILKVNSGERLDQIIQKFSLMIANGLGVCTADNVHHAPYNVYAEDITDTTLSVVWGGISSLSTSFNVYFDTVAGPTGWVLANTLPIATAVSDFQITALTPATEYKIKVVSTFGGSVCDSVEILVTTLA